MNKIRSTSENPRPKFLSHNKILIDLFQNDTNNQDKYNAEIQNTDADGADETDENPSDQRNLRPKFLGYNSKSLNPVFRMKEILWMEGIAKIKNNDADHADKTDKNLSNQRNPHPKFLGCN